MSSLPRAALSPSWPIKCLSCLLPGTALKSRLLSVTEVDQAEAPGPAALGIPTPVLLLPRTGLSVTASLNGICCTEDKVVPLLLPPAPEPARPLPVWVLVLRELVFFLNGGLFRDQLLFPECFCWETP